MADFFHAALRYLESLYVKLPEPWWATLVAYEVLLFGQWTAERLALRRHGAPPPGRGTKWLWPICAILLQVPPIRAGRWWMPIHGHALPIAGITVVIMGGALRLWAISHLGRRFSYRTQAVSESQLVTTGPYRRIRHPLYAGLLLFLWGLPLVLPEVSSWCVIVLVTTTIVAIRIRKEEREMRERHGAEFEAYRARTRMLVPGLL